MNIEGNSNQEAGQNGNKDFEGNYMENFKLGFEEEFFPGQIISWKQKPHKITVYAQHTALEIKVIKDGIFKFRFSNDGYFEDDFSYAIDPGFEPIDTPYTLTENQTFIEIETQLLTLLIDKDDTRMTIRDKLGNELYKDEKGYHWKEEDRYGGHVVISTIENSGDHKYYGLGDKTGHLNLNGSRRELWGTDCYGYGNSTDPVYKNIPFFTSLHNGIGSGIFMDNSFRSFFDFGKERPEALSFWAQGGEMRFYFIYGPSLLDVCRKFAELTGTAPLPPKWALGYHQSKWSYYPESTVRELAKTLREKKIPCDVIHLDIDYMDGYRCFTWDRNRFPDPQKMISDLKNDGFKTIVIIDPGIKIDPLYPIYQQGVHHDYFCQRMDGARFKGSVWPGPCHFPDFTKPAVREWWAGLFGGLITDGVAGVWNDMNEPAVFEEGTFPVDVRHDYDGHPCSHRKGHNVYGMQMARSTYAGLTRFNANKRSFTITRSAYAGTQRYSSVWTGDNVASWEHLKIANIQCQRLSTSGISFVGSDVGGFIGSPDGELYTRWIQLAVFHPFFRTHSSGDHGDKEPWMFDEKYLKIVRRFIELRYEILPYLYSAFWHHTEYGDPVIRSLSTVYQDDKETLDREEEFLLGDHMLVCPVTEPGLEKRNMYLPQGDWYHFWDQQTYSGKQEISIDCPLYQIPLFIQAGAVIPMQPSMQYVNEFEPENQILQFFLPLENCNVTSFLYEDDGESLDFEKGFSTLSSFVRERNNKTITLEQERTGSFKTHYEQYELFINGSAAREIQTIICDGEEIGFGIDENKIALKIQKDFATIEINLK